MHRVGPDAGATSHTLRLYNTELRKDSDARERDYGLRAPSNVARAHRSEILHDLLSSRMKSEKNCANDKSDQNPGRDVGKNDPVSQSSPGTRPW
jgi:hypothetical protein